MKQDSNGIKQSINKANVYILFFFNTIIFPEKKNFLVNAL